MIGKNGEHRDRKQVRISVQSIGVNNFMPEYALFKKRLVLTGPSLLNFGKACFFRLLSYTEKCFRPTKNEALPSE